MKKIITFMLLLSLIQSLQACKQCRGYQGRRLRQAPIEQIACDCDCSAQYHTNIGDKKGYGCIQCGHRLMPIDPTFSAKPIKVRKKTKKS